MSFNDKVIGNMGVDRPFAYQRVRTKLEDCPLLKKQQN